MFRLAPSTRNHPVSCSEKKLVLLWWTHADDRFAEAGSSAPGSVPGLQGQLSTTPNESNGCFARKDSGSPSLRQDLFRPAQTSKKATEAKQLLDKVSQSINPAVINTPIAEADSGLAGFPDVGELSFPRLNSQDAPSSTLTISNSNARKHASQLEPSVEQGPGESGSSGSGGGTWPDAAASEASAPARRQVNGGMKASGSFSDALQLLLQSRPSSNPPAKLKPAFPRPRSGLMHVVPAPAIAPNSGNVDAHGRSSGKHASPDVEEAMDGSVADSCAAVNDEQALNIGVSSSSSVPRDLHALPTSLLDSYDPCCTQCHPPFYNVCCACCL